MKFLIHTLVIFRVFFNLGLVHSSTDAPPTFPSCVDASTELCNDLYTCTGDVTYTVTFNTQTAGCTFDICSPGWYAGSKYTGDLSCNVDVKFPLTWDQNCWEIEAQVDPSKFDVKGCGGSSCYCDHIYLRALANDTNAPDGKIKVCNGNVPASITTYKSRAKQIRLRFRTNTKWHGTGFCLKYTLNSVSCSRVDESPLNWEWEHDWGSIVVQDGEIEEEET